LGAPYKQGLDYYPREIGMMKDRKFRKPRMKHGYVVNEVYDALLDLIYGDKGYYLDYSEPDDVIWEIQQYLFGKYQVSTEEIADIVAELVACGLFSDDHYRAKILTSKRVQKVFYKATVDRKAIDIDFGIWLLSEGEMTELSSKSIILDKFINRPINGVNQPINNVIQPDNPQSKEKKSKGEESIEKNSTGVGARVDCRRIVEIFNSVCKSLPKVKSLTDPRKKAIQRAAQEIEKAGGFTVLFEKVEASDFLAGRSGAWCAGFDWILKPANLSKILEGNYDNRAGRKKAATSIDDSSLDLDEYEKAVQDFVPVFGKKDAT
jgi:hypothetical protein